MEEKKDPRKVLDELSTAIQSVKSISTERALERLQDALSQVEAIINKDARRINIINFVEALDELCFVSVAATGSIPPKNEADRQSCNRLCAAVWDVKERLSQAFSSVQAFQEGGEMELFFGGNFDCSPNDPDNMIDVFQLEAIADNYLTLAPIIGREAEAASEEKGSQLTIKEFFETPNEDGETLFDKCLSGVGNIPSIPPAFMEIDVADSRLPEKYLMLHSKVGSTVFGGKITNLGEREIAVGDRANRKSGSPTTVKVRYDDPAVTYSRPLENSQKTIYDAICTIYNDQKDTGKSVVFTASQLLRVIRGFSNSEYCTPENERMLVEEIEHLRDTKLYIDFTEQARLYGLDVDEAIMDDRMLSVERTTVKSGGHVMTGYTFNHPPILYKYSAAFNQITSVPYELMRISDTTNATWEKTDLRNALLFRIQAYKDGAMFERKILYSYLCEQLGIDIKSLPDTKKYNTLRRIRQNTGDILDNLVKKGYITGYKSVKKGRTITGVEFAISPAEEKTRTAKKKKKT